MFDYNNNKRLEILANADNTAFINDLLQTVDVVRRSFAFPGDKRRLQQSGQMHKLFLPYRLQYHLRPDDYKAPYIHIQEKEIDGRRPLAEVITSLLPRYLGMNRTTNTVYLVELTAPRAFGMRQFFETHPTVPELQRFETVLRYDNTNLIRITSLGESGYLIVCNKVTHALLLRLAIAFAALFPQYLEGTLPLDPSIFNDSVDEAAYNAAFEAWAAPFVANMREEQRLRAAHQFFTAFNEARVNTASRRIQRAEQDVSAAITQYRENLKILDRRRMEAFNAQRISNDDSKSYINYLSRHRYIANVSFPNGNDSATISLCISGPLKHFNQDHAKMLSKSGHSSPLGGGREGIFANAATLQAFDNIFLNCTDQLWITQEVSLDFENNRHQAINGNRLNKGIPNTHLLEFNCWGDNAPIIERAFQNGQYPVMTEQVVSSCLSFNVMDGVVLNRMFNRLNSRDNQYTSRCVLLENGDMLAWSDYLRRCAEQVANPTGGTAQ